MSRPFDNLLRTCELAGKDFQQCLAFQHSGVLLRRSIEESRCGNNASAMVLLKEARRWAIALPLNSSLRRLIQSFVRGNLAYQFYRAGRLAAAERVLLAALRVDRALSSRGSRPAKYHRVQLAMNLAVIMGRSGRFRHAFLLLAAIGRHLNSIEFGFFTLKSEHDLVQSMLVERKALEERLCAFRARNASSSASGSNISSLGLNSKIGSMYCES